MNIFSEIAKNYREVSEIQSETTRQLIIAKHLLLKSSAHLLVLSGDNCLCNDLEPHHELITEIISFLINPTNCRTGVNEPPSPGVQSDDPGPVPSSNNVIRW